MKLKLPKIRIPLDQLDFMVLVSLGLIGAGVNEIFGRGSAMLCTGSIILMLAMIIARGKTKGATQ
tara:strand:+ start:124 stop:318 length:195 start_codon:yes stop_codon:yes gene_type:complete